jgi:hypothetical protein
MGRTCLLVASLLLACGGSPAGLGRAGGATSTRDTDAGVRGSGNDSEPRPTPGELTIQGVVSETTSEGRRAIYGASVNAWIQESGGFGYSYWWVHGATFSNAGGHFDLSRIAESATARLQVWKEGYVQQCASPRVTMTSDVLMDVQLVSRSSLSAAPESVPPPLPGYRLISGAVFDPGAPGSRPVEGALVDFEPVMDFPAAMTFSDADGRYLLCGIPDAESVEVCAGLAGRVGCVSVPAGQTTGVDITLQADEGP